MYTITRSGVRLDEGRVTGWNRAHPRYFPVDPMVIRNKLMARGFDVTKLSRLGRKSGVHGMEVLYPRSETAANEYEDFARILFDHRGKSSVRYALGQLRMNCSNQFVDVPNRLHHCGEEIRQFVEDPAEFLLRRRSAATEFGERIRELEHAPNRGRLLLHALTEKAPRLGRLAREGMALYNDHRSSTWSLLQGLTHTGRPRLVRMASYLLSNHFDSLKAGMTFGIAIEDALKYSANRLN